MSVVRATYGPSSLAITAVLGTTAAMQIEGYGGFHLYCPASVDSAATLTCYTSSTEDGTFQAATDNVGTALTITVSNATNAQIPPDLFGAAWVKFVSNTGSFTATVTASE